MLARVQYWENKADMPMAVFEDDSSRTRMIAPILYSPYYLQYERRSLLRCRSSRSQSNCSKNDRSDSSD
jgi:hypothetical protein